MLLHENEIGKMLLHMVELCANTYTALHNILSPILVRHSEHKVW